MSSSSSKFRFRLVEESARAGKEELLMTPGRGRFPRVFGDRFGDKFSDKFGDKFSDSPNLVTNVVTNLVTNLVNHQNR